MALSHGPNRIGVVARCSVSAAPDSHTVFSTHKTLALAPDFFLSPDHGDVALRAQTSIARTARRGQPVFTTKMTTRSIHT